MMGATMPSETAVTDYGATEPELAVIPESPKSEDEDSTSQQTVRSTLYTALFAR
jgi:hypothetical protein